MLLLLLSFRVYRPCLQVISVCKSADLLLMVLDATKPWGHKEILTRELEAVGIRINRWGMCSVASATQRVCCCCCCCRHGPWRFFDCMELWVQTLGLGIWQAWYVRMWRPFVQCSMG